MRGRWGGERTWQLLPDIMKSIAMKINTRQVNKPKMVNAPEGLNQVF